MGLHSTSWEQLMRRVILNIGEPQGSHGDTDLLYFIDQSAAALSDDDPQLAQIIGWVVDDAVKKLQKHRPVNPAMPTDVYFSSRYYIRDSIRHRVRAMIEERICSQEFAIHDF